MQLYTFIKQSINSKSISSQNDKPDISQILHTRPLQSHVALSLISIIGQNFSTYPTCQRIIRSDSQTSSPQPRPQERALSLHLSAGFTKIIIICRRNRCEHFSGAERFTFSTQPPFCDRLMFQASLSPFSHQRR